MELTRQRIEERLTELRLPSIRQSYEEMAERATRESLGYREYLGELVEIECLMRRVRRIERRLTESKLPLEKSLERFDMTRLSMKARQQFAALLDGGFVDRKENVLAFGNPGSGKTHALCALGQALARQDRRVLFVPCSLLVQDLLLAKRELALPRMLKRLTSYEALLIDDIGYVQQSREEMEVLFTLLAQRYEQGSVLLTSNLPFSQWERIFKDPMTTAAAIDRLVHHSVILELNLPSYRMEEAQRNQQIGGEETRPARDSGEAPVGDPGAREGEGRNERTTNETNETTNEGNGSERGDERE
jgi:DNA replication protein DnaC